MDPFIGILILVIIIGVAVGIAPMDQALKNTLYKAIGFIIFVLLLLWVLGLFGLIPHGAHVPR